MVTGEDIRTQLSLLNVVATQKEAKRRGIYM